MTKTIFYLNGPPSSGKNTLCDYIVSKNQTFTEESNAGPLKRAVCALHSISDAERKYLESTPARKNEKYDKFYGRSWRELCIEMSENFAKKEYSPAFFGDSLINRIKSNPKNRIIITDSGFGPEIMPVIEEFGSKNIHLIKLIPNYLLGEDAPTTGKFKGDSRSYLSGAELGVKEHMLHNCHLDAFLMAGDRLLYSLVY